MSPITATYRVAAAASDIAHVAQAIALEQSVELPLAAVHDAYVAERIVARVAGIRGRADGRHDVAIELSAETTGGDVAQLVNMLFGNSSLHAHVELVDVAWPAEFVTRFAGPRHGAAGVRRVLGTDARPLTCAALKPQGLPVERLAALAYTLAAAGIDVVKDDHGLADQAYAPFAARVEACQRAIDRAAADTGHRALYAPSVVGSPRRAAAQVREARASGAGALLLAPALLGLPAFAELVHDDIDVPVIAHPAFAGATRIAHPLLLGTLFRLLGADAVIFPHSAGRFAFAEATCREIAARARAPFHALAPTLPVPAGGLQVEGVASALAFYGHDVMLLIGGSLLIEPDGVRERAARFVAAVRDASAAHAASAEAAR
ncbi:MAG: RuBisCO large subunit C-terminal-like domain-containing protein [Burkholderiales bacterium]